MNKNTKYRILNCCVALVIITTSCKKKIDSTSKTENNTFLRVWSMTGTQGGNFIKQTSDGNFLVFWSDNTKPVGQNAMVSKMDRNGKLLSSNSVAGDNGSDYFINTDDGGALLCGSGYLIKFDKDGNKIFETYTNDDYMVSIPLQVKDSDSSKYPYLAARTNGNISGAASINRLYFFDKNGTQKSGTITMPDAWFGCKVGMINVYRFEAPQTYYFWGYGYINWNGDWAKNPHTFFAKIQLDLNNNLVDKQVIFTDQSDNTEFLDRNAWAPYAVVNKDKSILVSVNYKNKLEQLNYGHLIKADSNLNIIWERNIPFEGSNQILAINKCSDAGFTVSGQVRRVNTKTNAPFFCRYDANGNLEWSQLLETRLYGEGWWGEQLSDGSFIFTGNTTSFGNGVQENDVFFLKTDVSGNWK